MTIAVKFPRWFVLCLLLVATLTSAVVTGTASAAATPQPVYYQSPPSVSSDLNECTGVTGTTTGVLTIQGQNVLGAAGTFHFHGTFTQDYRSDWSDGTYLISHAVTQFSLDGNATGTATQTEAEQDRGTVYSSTGQVLGYQLVISMFHITFADGNLTTITFGQPLFRCP